MIRDPRTYSDTFRDARVLITGGAGFIGSHLALTLRGLGAQVRVIDDLSSGHERNLAVENSDGPAIEFVKASILDDAALNKAAEGCRFVFHHAAMVSVPQSVAEPGRCMEVNVLGTERVLNAARKAGASRVMFAASAAAYGNDPKLPSTETDLPDIWSPYAQSKVAGEMLLATYARCYGLSTVSLRYFNVFGPRQDPKSPYAAVITAFADALMNGKTPKVFGDGSQTRDFIPIENVVHANLLAASSPRALAGEVVNIGCGGRVSLIDVLNVMGAVLGVPATPEKLPPRAGDVMHSSANIGRAREVLGFAPIVGFDEGIRRTLEWARKSGGK